MDNKNRTHVGPLILTNTEVFIGLSGVPDTKNIIFVIDNSESMEPYQDNISNKLIKIIEDLYNLNIPFRVAVTTTDPLMGGQFFKHDDAPPSSRILEYNPREEGEDPDPEQELNYILDNLKLNLNVGTSGTSEEKGLMAAGNAVFNSISPPSGFWQNPQYGFIGEPGEDTATIIIIVSDSNDKGTKAERDHAMSILLSTYNNRKGVLIIQAIVDTKSADPDLKGTHYTQAAGATPAGKVYDINDDFEDIAEDIFERIIIPKRTTFPLQYPPIENRVQVYINNSLIKSGWTFKKILPNPVVHFNPDNCPEALDIVEIIYRYEAN